VWSKFSQGLEFFIFGADFLLGEVDFGGFFLSSSLGEFGGGLIFSNFGGQVSCLFWAFFSSFPWAICWSKFLGSKGADLMPCIHHFWRFRA
jgi:hypothetical protein